MTTLLRDVNRQAIKELVLSLEPVASVYVGLALPAPTADASEDLSLRWRAMSTELAAQGAPTATIDALEGYLGSLPIYLTELALFASTGGTLRQHELPGGVPFDRASFAAPAQVAPLVSWLQRHPPFVAIVVDRAGADVTEVKSGTTVGVTETVVGPDDEIERNAPGGWAQPRYQRRAEDSWRHNAAAVAEAAIHALRRVDGELLLVAGDVRAVQLLEDRLRDHSGHRIVVRHVPGGRQPDGSTSIRRAAIAHELAGYAAQRTADVLERFENERRPHGRAVEGAADTLSALAAGRADTLIIADDPRDSRTAWYGPDLLGVDSRFRASGAVTALRSGRLVDIAVRAALLTDADVTIIDAETPATPAERIGAICRYQ